MTTRSKQWTDSNRRKSLSQTSAAHVDGLPSWTVLCSVLLCLLFCSCFVFESKSKCHLAIELLKHFQFIRIRKRCEKAFNLGGFGPAVLIESFKDVQAAIGQWSYWLKSTWISQLHLVKTGKFVVCGPKSRPNFVIELWIVPQWKDLVFCTLIHSTVSGIPQSVLALWGAWQERPGLLHNWGACWLCQLGKINLALSFVFLTCHGTSDHIARVCKIVHGKTFAS
jgi:hypothetical protein